MRFIVLRGLPASGKSTWAKEYVAKHPNTLRWNNDEFSYMTTGISDGGSFDVMDVRYLTNMRLMAIDFAYGMNKDLILDNTNLNPRIFDELNGYGEIVETLDFEVDATECVMRNIGRGCPIPNRVIHEMADKWRHLYEWV